MQPLLKISLVAGLALLAVTTLLHPASPVALSRSAVSPLRTRILQLDKKKALAARWDHVYVINLESRSDRKRHMDSLSSALGIPFTYIPAITKDNPVVPFILERLLEEQMRAKSPQDFPAEVRGWGKGGDLTWREVALLALSADPPEYPLDPPVKPPRLVYPASYFAAKQNIHPLGPTACTLSHILAYKTAIAAGDRSFLLLEDDVDIDFGIESLWQSMSEAMEVREQGWDIVYLGWSWSSERAFRPKFHPLLRPSNSPSGLHGVAFSWRGVRRVHDFLTTSPVLFSRPIDHEIPKGMVEGARLPNSTIDFVSFSATPPLIIPGVENLESDIGGVGGTDWGGLLADSTLARIREAEGRPAQQLSELEISKSRFISTL